MTCSARRHSISKRRASEWLDAMSLLDTEYRTRLPPGIAVAVPEPIAWTRISGPFASCWAILLNCPGKLVWTNRASTAGTDEGLVVFDERVEREERAVIDPQLDCEGRLCMLAEQGRIHGWRLCVVTRR